MRKWILAVLVLFCFVPPAFAVPSLQLGITGGEYDFDTDTTVAPADVFQLFALVDRDLADKTTTFYLSVAVAPQIDTATSLGSFFLDSPQVIAELPHGVNYTNHTYDVVADMVYGTPPLEAFLSTKDLAPHGTFPTYYLEFAFDLNGAALVPEINVEPNDLEGDADSAKTLWRVDFAVDVGAFSDDYILHFDLYTEYFKNNDGSKFVFAPFSHDAGSGGGDGGGGGEGDPIPEPSTLILLGGGLISLVAYRRKKH